MKVTAILRNFADEWLEDLAKLSAVELFEKLEKMSFDKRVPLQVGGGSFRDRLELNQLRRGPHDIKAKIEPRRGYKLATFSFSKA